MSEQLTLNLFPETEKQVAEKQMIKVAKQPNSNGKLFQKAVADDAAEYKKLAQEQYTKDDRGNSKDAFKNFTAPGKDGYPPKKEKPYYMHNPKTNTLDDVNNPGPFEQTLNNIQKKPAPKVRQETGEERINRIVWEFDDTGKAVKPAHYNNPNIVKFENWKRKPEPFKNDDASTYPSDIDQRQKLSTWDLMVKIAKTPLEKKEIRETLKDHYKKHGPGLMDSKELRMIGKHPDQLKAYITPITKPIVPVVVAPKKPEIPIEELIKRAADEKLYQEQQRHDYEYGRGGLAALSRPK
ncbi:MAG TPA: hypothetical protein DEG69_23350 [Flavobacteriaceae bacterium]|nr:hypothetical protein [Flavobacteriaceae bacterium]|tara:strand:+ start:109 stop:993 length:885 start_codon:yes stop_codon:yes gene_type:complete